MQRLQLMNTILALIVLVLLGVIAWQQMRISGLTADLQQSERSLEAGMTPFFILGQLRIAAQKVPARRVKAAVEAVFRTDIALKSSGGDPRILIERLVVEMCESRRL